MKTIKTIKCTCSECGSDNVETRQWLNLKTDRAESISNDVEDNWCNECQEHVELLIEIIKS